MRSARGRFSTRPAVVRGAIVASAAVIGLALAPTFASAAVRGQLEALVVERAASPLLGSLERRLGDRWDLRVARGDDLRRVRRFDALVVDGDDLTPRQLARRATAMRRFLDAGRAVVALDMDRADLRRGLRHVIGISVTGAERGQRHRAIVIQRVIRGRTARYEILEGERLAPDGLGRLPRAERARVRRAATDRLAATILRRIRAGDRRSPRAAAAQTQDARLPVDLQQVTWEYTSQGEAIPPIPYWSLRDNPDAARRRRQFGATADLFMPRQGRQTAQWSMTHTFDLALDNGSRPGGDFQVITYHLDGSFRPRRPDGEFAFMDEPASIRSDFGATSRHYVERAWWTGLAEVSVEATDAPAKLDLADASPLPSSGQVWHWYDTAARLELGYRRPDDDGRGVRDTLSTGWRAHHAIDDWSLEWRYDYAGKAHWLFSSRLPCDASNRPLDWDTCFDRGIGKDAMPQRPNAVSRERLPFDLYARWNTRRLLGPSDGSVTFRVQTPITLLDTYCSGVASVLGLLWCRDDQMGHARHAIGARPEDTMVVRFNAGDVVPVGIAAVTLDPGEADGSRRAAVTGTVTLKAPGRLPQTRVTILSDSPHADVGTPLAGGGSRTVVTIPRGRRSATFAIRTDDDGLRPGERTTARITAFYAEPTVARLTIRRP